MDPHGDEVIELVLDLFEVELGRKRDKTRAMEEQLRTERAAMEAKETECLMLIEERDHLLALKKAMDKLVTDFLDADGSKNFDAQKAMENQILAFIGTYGSGDGSDTEGSGGGVNGENIGHLENIQDKNEQAGMETIVGQESAVTTVSDYLE